MRPKQTLLLFLVVLCCPKYTQAQAWSGIIDPSRAIDWSGAGVVGGIPTRTTICSTLSPGATAAQINSAIAACPANQVVFLSSGTFNLTTGIQMRSNVTLRGAGANSTFLVFTGNNSCGGDFASICMSLDSTWTGNASIQPGGSNAATWSGGYSPGATSITLTSVGNSGLSVGKYIYLDQANVTSDPGTLFVCDNTTLPCSLEGGSPGRTVSGAKHNQIQFVKITNISGTTYTITPGLYGINWSSAQSPGAWWASTQIQNAGVENLSMDNTQNGGGYSGVAFVNAFNCWVKGVRSMYSPCSSGCASGRNHIWFVQSAHNQVQDSYFYGTIAAASLSYGIESFMAGDNLVTDNIFQKIAGPIVMGPSQGSVFAYNFSIDDFINLSTYLSVQSWAHDAGVLYNLYEGNIGAGFYGDLFHGTGGANTFFRNRWNGNECTGGTCDTGGNFVVRLDAYHRAENSVGNVLGTTGVHRSYTNGTSPPIFNIGNGNTEGSVVVPSDPLVASTLMRWGNYDTVTAAVRWCGNSSDPGWSTTCSSTSEIPTALSTYANAVPSSTTLPASFYYSSQPSWWPFGKAWPPIGPDVSGGNLGVCSGGSYNLNMAAGSGQCTGGSLVTAVAGHANSIPAMDYYLSVMGGPPDGTGSVLTFNAATSPAPPTNLTAIPH